MCLHPQPVWFTTIFESLLQCMQLSEDMPLLTNVFSLLEEQKPSGKNPSGKSRASPLKNSPPRDEEDELSPDSCIGSFSSDESMENIGDDQGKRSNPQDVDIPMDQVDYDPDSSSNLESETDGAPSEGQPKSKAMPKKPPLAPLRLTPKSKAQPSASLDDETESDQQVHLRPANADRSPLPRRKGKLTVKAPPPSINFKLHQEAWKSQSSNPAASRSEGTGSEDPFSNIRYCKETTNPYPFWNQEFVRFVEQYYHECANLHHFHKDFHFIPEHDRPADKPKPAWLQARFDDYWQSTIRGKDKDGVADYMEFTKRIYKFCCYIQDDPKNFTTEVIPTVNHNGQIDMTRTSKNVAALCHAFSKKIDPSHAEHIVGLILWRVERLSRLFSENLRHNAWRGKECREPIHVNLDGSAEFWEVLMQIVHAKNFLGVRPGIFLMTVFPTFGKSRFEIAFVYPKFDGTYEERAAIHEIVPKHRWISNPADKAAASALKPDGQEYYHDKSMEMYIRCIAGHSRHVEIDSIGKPLYQGHQKEQHWPEPDRDLPRSYENVDADEDDEQDPHRRKQSGKSSHEKRTPSPKKIVPFEEYPLMFAFHATYADQLEKIQHHGLMPGKESRPGGGQHVHLACIDDVLYDDAPRELAWKYAPKGRDALLILAFDQNNEYNLHLSGERIILTDRTIHTNNIVAMFGGDGEMIMQNNLILKTWLSRDEKETVDMTIPEFATHFFQWIRTTKDETGHDGREQSEKKKRRHSSGHADEDMQSTEDRSVRPKVSILDFLIQDDVESFHDDFNKEDFNRSTTKEEAPEEFLKVRSQFQHLMTSFKKNPDSLKEKLSEGEMRSLRHVDPKANFPELEFFYESSDTHPTLEEFRRAQSKSGYPIMLPLGIKKLRYDTPDKVIKKYTDILVSIFTRTDGPEIDYLKPREYSSGNHLNVLTVNHGNLSRNPRIDGRELKDWPVQHRPILMQLIQNSSNILCINEADLFTEPYTEENKQIIRLFLRAGYKGIVLKQWSSRTIACFVRGGEHARVELLARYISTKAKYWSTTFGMFRCYFGLEPDCVDPSYDIPTSDCLATTGLTMKDDQHRFIGDRLPPRTAIQKLGRNGEIIVVQIREQDEMMGDIPRSVRDPKMEFDHRHVTRADLPFATVGVFHIHPNVAHGGAMKDMKEGILPFVTEYQCDILTGDANKSANTFSRYQQVYDPESGLMNYLMKNYQKMWNEAAQKSEYRVDITMTTTTTIKSLVRHHIHTTTGSGYDRTFPDCMMTFVFGWGKTDIQNAHRKEEEQGMTKSHYAAMLNDPEAVVSDYLVTSSERFKRISNLMFMIGSQDSESHVPLFVYIRSCAENKKRNHQRYKELVQRKKKEEKNERGTSSQSWSQSKQQGWKDFSYSNWKDYDWASQSDSSNRWNKGKW